MELVHIAGLKQTLTSRLEVISYDPIRTGLHCMVHLARRTRNVSVSASDTASEARALIGRYLDFYNRRRPHSSLDGTTSDHAYFTPLLLHMAA